MTLNLNNGSNLGLLRGLQAAALAAVAALLVACGGDSDCASPPAFGGEQVGECVDDGGGGGSTAPTAADLSLTLTVNGVAATSLPNDGSSTITATVTAVDANRNVVAEIPVTVSVDADATAAVSGAATDDLGVVTAAVGIGADRSNRTVTVTATSGGLVRTANFQVVGANLTGTPLPAVIAPGAAGKVDFTLKASNEAAMSGQSIVVSGTDGSSVTGTTDANGKYSYGYTAPASAGSLNISATAGGVTQTVGVLVQASGSTSIPPATVTVQSASVSASPSVVQVNTASTTNQAEMRALFIGANNTAVKNVRVRFDLDGDTNGIGGTFTTGTDIVYSDANGVATSAYVPASRFSPTNGVTVRACWDYNDFAVGVCPNAAQTTLTVVSDTLSVTIGTNALIEVGSSGLDYVKKYLVQVNDSSGSAKSGVQISPSVDLPQYQKGFWSLVFVGTTQRWVQTVLTQCDNEDLNRNGVLQVYSNGAVEDANGNGTLDPRKADVNISVVGSSTTDVNGQVILKITYPQSVGSWDTFKIQVAASGVAGTEGRATYSGVLPVLAADVNNKDVEPAFRLSPYGVEASPTVLTTNPLGQSGQLCTNKN